MPLCERGYVKGRKNRGKETRSKGGEEENNGVFTSNQHLTHRSHCVYLLYTNVYNTMPTKQFPEVDIAN